MALGALIDSLNRLTKHFWDLPEEGIRACVEVINAAVERVPVNVLFPEDVIRAASIIGTKATPYAVTTGVDSLGALPPGLFAFQVEDDDA